MAKKKSAKLRHKSVNSFGVVFFDNIEPRDCGRRSQGGQAQHDH